MSSRPDSPDSPAKRAGAPPAADGGASGGRPAVSVDLVCGAIDLSRVVDWFAKFMGSDAGAAQLFLAALTAGTSPWVAAPGSPSPWSAPGQFVLSGQHCLRTDAKIHQFIGKCLLPL
jgi:hypothetical protein